MGHDELDPESELRPAPTLVRASHLASFRAIGADVIDVDWQHGQPVPDRLLRLVLAESRLWRVIDIVVGVVEGRPECSAGEGTACVGRPREHR